MNKKQTVKRYTIELPAESRDMLDQLVESVHKTRRRLLVEALELYAERWEKLRKPGKAGYLTGPRALRPDQSPDAAVPDEACASVAVPDLPMVAPDGRDTTSEILHPEDMV